VLLLEAGRRSRKLEMRVSAAFSKLFQSEVDWAFRTDAQAGLDGREVFFPLGKTLGGSSAINAMMVLRGHRRDQDPWPPGWSWDHVEPTYRASAAGPFPLVQARDRSPLTRAFVDSAVAAGVRLRDDLNEPDNEGVGFVPVSQRRGGRFGVADGYLGPARRRPNLTVLTETLAARLVIESGRVVGVSYRSAEGEEVALAGREVIVCSGAIGSPKLLLCPGIGPAAEQRAVGVDCVHDLPGVGKNLRDHLADGVLAATRTGMTTLASAESLRNVVRWLAAGRGPLASNVAEAAAFVRTRPDLDAPDLELIFAPVPFEGEGLVEPSRDGVTVAAVLLQPRSVGRYGSARPTRLTPPVSTPATSPIPRGTTPRLSFVACASPAAFSPASRSRARWPARSSLAPARRTTKRCSPTSVPRHRRCITLLGRAGWATTSSRSSIRAYGFAASRACASSTRP
jgi:choline dehydrogenase